MSETPKIHSPERKTTDSVYLYDFGQALLYNDPAVHSLLDRITRAHIERWKWLGRGGFTLKTAIGADGSSVNFADLKIPHNAPRESVEGIFRDLNASGLVRVELTDEVYPRVIDSVQAGVREDILSNLS